VPQTEHDVLYFLDSHTWRFQGITADLCQPGKPLLNREDLNVHHILILSTVCVNKHF
jgi:hypothetical protein